MKTRAPENRTVTVYFRIPANYKQKQTGLWRVLILFGGRNSDGRSDVTGRLGWGEWADKHGIFLVCPGFRNDNYWEPEEWSGRALFSALAAIRKQYEICTEKLLFYGYSAGSQCSNLFPAWRPGSTRAWVSHACGVFHEPGGRMRSVPGLEDKRGKDYLLSQLQKIATPEALLARMDYSPHVKGQDVLFMTGIGKIHPFMRSHKMLDSMQHLFEDIPIVMFYPGSFNEQTLNLFNEFLDGHYYRAFNLL